MLAMQRASYKPSVPFFDVVILPQDIHFLCSAVIIVVFLCAFYYFGRNLDTPLHSEVWDSIQVLSDIGAGYV